MNFESTKIATKVDKVRFLPELAPRATTFIFSVGSWIARTWSREERKRQKAADRTENFRSADSKEKFAAALE